MDEPKKLPSVYDWATKSVAREWSIPAKPFDMKQSPYVRFDSNLRACDITFIKSLQQSLSHTLDAAQMAVAAYNMQQAQARANLREELFVVLRDLPLSDAEEEAILFYNARHPYALDHQMMHLTGTLPDRWAVACVALGKPEPDWRGYHAKRQGLEPDDELRKGMYHIMHSKIHCFLSYHAQKERAGG